jgi:hypothetical protein
MLGGEVRVIPLAADEAATVAIEPERGFDCGAGPGKPIERQVRGGTVGVILDARGRPLVIPPDREVGRALVETWVSAADLYSHQTAR